MIRLEHALSQDDWRYPCNSGKCTSHVDEQHHKRVYKATTAATGAAGHLKFGPLALCVAHALKGLARRVSGLLAHAVVTKNDGFFDGSKT